MLDVYLIHGLYMNRYVMRPLAQHVREAGHVPHLVAHDTIAGSLVASATRLRDAIERGVRARRRVIIGHSLGSVVATYTATRFPQLAVDDVILLGSPFNDSAAARGLARLPGGARMVGGPLRDWLALKDFTPRQGLRLWAIVGNRRAGLGQYVGGFTEQPSDGTVLISEASIASAHACAVLPVSHMQMLVSRLVAQQVTKWLSEIDERT